jgi:hypothetical protein
MSYKIAVVADFGQMFKHLMLCPNKSWAMEYTYKVKKYEHYLYFDIILMSFKNELRPLRNPGVASKTKVAQN